PLKRFAGRTRAMPLKRVALPTRVTPDIAFPNLLGEGSPRSFWVEVMAGGSREKFKFHAIARDAAGKSVDFTIPLMFVSKMDLTAPAMKSVADEYNDPKNLTTRAAKVPGQKVALAAP